MERDQSSELPLHERLALVMIFCSQHPIQSSTRPAKQRRVRGGGGGGSTSRCSRRPHDVRLRRQEQRESWFGGDTPASGLLFAPEPRFLRFFSSSFPVPSSRIRLLAPADCSLCVSSASIFLFLVGSPQVAHQNRTFIFAHINAKERP
jgi:hypothetical protein